MKLICNVLKLKEIIGFIFMLLTVLGTQTHEWGHYIVAKKFDFNPTLHYARVSLGIEQEQSDDFFRKELLFRIAGPLQTIITGIFGLTILFFRRKIRKSTQFSIIDWIGVFLSLFWLRQCLNLIVSVVKTIIKNKISFGGDEGKVSRMLGLYPGTIGILLGSLGLMICSYVILVILPKENRYNLVVGGILGSLFGFIVWFGFIGKIILP